MQPQESQHVLTSERSAKKVYQKPELQVYGDLARITGTVGAMGKGDNPAGMNKTGV